MARVTTTLLIFLILGNGAVTIMSSSGLADDMGVELAPGISDTSDSIIESMKAGIDPQTSIVESLVGLAITVGRLFKLIIESVYALPTMFTNLGFPSYIVVAFFAPAYVIATLELAYLMLGRSGRGI